MANIITKQIPNSITCCNLICGCIAIHFAFMGVLDWAVLFIILGAVFDFFDGMTARLLGVSSPIGKELDSLADVVTFGVAPSAILFQLICQLQSTPESLHALMPYLPYAAFIMAAFSALRLAKFNLDTRQTTSFIGLPTPANALFWGSLVVGHHTEIITSPYALPLLLVGIALFSFLLVAELPLFALKFKNLSWRDNWVKYVFLIGCLPCFLLGYSCFAAIILWYVLWAAITRKVA